MPTDKPRLTFTADEETFKRIDDYRYKYRLKNQTQAIISLIELGLNSLDPNAPISKPSETIPAGIKKIAKDYDSLDSHGKRLVQIVVKEEKKRIAAQTEQGGGESAELDLQEEAEDGLSTSSEQNAG